MEFITLERSSDNKIRPLTKEQVLAVCRRGFGQGVQIKSVQELGGGTFNTTYLVTLIDKSKLVLRVGPSPARDIYWDDVALMRREHQIQPFFASIATLMPQVIMIDFTHQLIERDYMFQSFIEGERWDEVENKLTDEENLVLWEQLGNIMRVIHSTTGENFGWPYPGPQFESWRELVIDRFYRIGKSMQQEQLDTTDLMAIVDIVQTHSLFLDEIRQPCLLHGDLWTFNVLVKRGEGGPTITGILDADRAWWGDPMADWTMFIWARGDGAEMDEARSLFWQGYGRPEETAGAAFRARVYEAMHTGAALVWAKQTYHEVVQRGLDDLREIAEMLPDI